MDVTTVRGATVTEAGWRRMRVPQLLWTSTVNQIDAKVRSEIMHYISNLSTLYRRGLGSLLLMGGPGSGKDAIASLILAEAWAWVIPSLYVDIRALRQGVLQREWFDREEGVTLTERVVRVQVLVVSRVVQEDAKHTVYGDGELAALVRRRTALGLVTILTARMEEGTWFKFYGDTADAMRDAMAGELVLPSVDRRAEGRERLNEAIFGRKGR